MSQDDETAGAFLYQLYQATSGNMEAQASTQAVGEALGLDKDGAGALAQALMMEELVELRTLAGGISLTDRGLAKLRDKGMVAAGSEEEAPKLSGEAVLTESDRLLLEKAMADIRMAVTEVEAGFEELETMIVDVKTIEVQLLSPHAKTAVIAAVLVSLQSGFSRLQRKDVSLRLRELLAEV